MTYAQWFQKRPDESHLQFRNICSRVRRLLDHGRDCEGRKQRRKAALGGLPEKRTWADYQDCLHAAYDLTSGMHEAIKQCQDDLDRDLERAGRRPVR